MNSFYKILTPIVIISLIVFAMPATTQAASTNVASQANGGVASASSEYLSGNYPASDANSGSRDNAKGNGWGGPPPSGGWNDNTPGSFPDFWQVDFNASYSINEIDVITLFDAYATSHPNPTLTDTFTLYGITDFTVQYWDGSTWQTVTGGAVTGNNKVWRQFTFAPVTTTKVRITVNASAGSNDYSRIVEVEAWTAPPANVTPVRKMRLFEGFKIKLTSGTLKVYQQ